MTGFSSVFGCHSQHWGTTPSRLTASLFHYCLYIFQCCSNRLTPHKRIYDMNVKVVYISLEQLISLLTSSWTSFRKINYCCRQQIHIFKFPLILRTVTGKKFVNFELIDSFKFFTMNFSSDLELFKCLAAVVNITKIMFTIVICNRNVHFWTWNSVWHRFWNKMVRQETLWKKVDTVLQFDC